MRFPTILTLGQIGQWPDVGLVREGLQLFEELPRNATRKVLLAPDLHAGNVVRAEREPWLVIDPKPFVGDPAYDTTQHLFNCRGRLRLDPDRTIRRFADLAGIGYERVRLWMFARAAAEPRNDWSNGDLVSLARSIALCLFRGFPPEGCRLIDHFWIVGCPEVTPPKDGLFLGASQK